MVAGSANIAAITNVQFVPPDEYIARFIEGAEKPVCEFVDGALIPKPRGSKAHSQVQANVTADIRLQHRELLNPLPELTARLREAVFYVPALQLKI